MIQATDAVVMPIPQPLESYNDAQLAEVGDVLTRVPRWRGMFGGRLGFLG
jgi:hypothetical protein